MGGRWDRGDRAGVFLMILMWERRYEVGTALADAWDVICCSVDGERKGSLAEKAVCCSGVGLVLSRETFLTSSHGEEEDSGELTNFGRLGAAMMSIILAQNDVLPKTWYGQEKGSWIWT
jgi:hypothetical protein